MTVRLGLIGTGTVGGGCLDILRNHKDEFRRHYGVDLEVVRVCSREPEVARSFGFEDVFTPDYREVVTDPNVDLVIELIGGTTVAHDAVCEALRNGKAVVTANKALMATAGEEVFSLAEEHGVEVAFEASVGGGIPIIDPLKHSLIANRISKVMGIVNGTTNYMLTRMDEEGASYEEALADAQARGFAEADPSADVDGLDAAAKIAILSSIAFNSRVNLSDVHAEGIRNITTTDLQTARDMGYCVKLMAIGHRTDDGVDVRVHPTMIPLSHQMAKVNGVYNAIYVVGDAVGETMFFGEGAGAGPAASAVMGDVLEVARHIETGVTSFVGCTCTDSLPIVPMDDLETKYYIRFPVADRPGVLASMAGIFADFGVSIYSVVQRGQKEAGTVEVVYVTHVARERDIRAVVAKIASLDDVLHSEPSIIRVED
ncbi:MAG: homoserine dehydrogenase [Berryella intestinalis]|uniref:homoserine dehydrogenase n=1 Tax=Berryella intestinalis TaxID=1531429 RepID=UPI002A4E8A9A|nr:homoserine dehydrogenase [Berryella intestinalis]MDD7368926.1 homoserine dehydrogenase [Berryella intestinalis]MDY3128598.1 homoserine dehydrogenase [Berryella intestinalis]